MRTKSPITVAVARFEDLLARGLLAVLEGDPNIEVVASDVEHERIGVILRAHHPGVAIIDVDALTNLAEVRQLSSQHPGSRLVLLATEPTVPECVQLLAFGASACLSRSTQARDVLTAIHLAGRGLQLIPSGRLEPVAAFPPAAQLLTQREAELLPMLHQGMSNAQIAAVMHIGVETVRTHARNIYRKLGVASRRELAALPARTQAHAPPAHGAPAASVQPSRHWIARGGPGQRRTRVPRR